MGLFQAETRAFLTLTNICLNRKYRHAALNSLKAHTCQSKLVWEYIFSLKQPATTNNVNLKADRLAKIAYYKGCIR